MSASYSYWSKNLDVTFKNSDSSWCFASALLDEAVGRYGGSVWPRLLGWSLVSSKLGSQCPGCPGFIVLLPFLSSPRPGGKDTALSLALLGRNFLDNLWASSLSGCFAHICCAKENSPLWPLPQTQQAHDCWVPGWTQLAQGPGSDSDADAAGLRRRGGRVSGSGCSSWSRWARRRRRWGDFVLSWRLPLTLDRLRSFLKLLLASAWSAARLAFCFRLLFARGRRGGVGSPKILVASESTEESQSDPTFFSPSFSPKRVCVGDAAGDVSSSTSSRLHTVIQSCEGRGRGSKFEKKKGFKRRTVKTKKSTALRKVGLLIRPRVRVGISNRLAGLGWQLAALIQGWAPSAPLTQRAAPKRKTPPRERGWEVDRLVSRLGKLGLRQSLKKKPAQPSLCQRTGHSRWPPRPKHFQIHVCSLSKKHKNIQWNGQLLSGSARLKNISWHGDMADIIALPLVMVSWSPSPCFDFSLLDPALLP